MTVNGRESASYTSSRTLSNQGVYCRFRLGCIFLLMIVLLFLLAAARVGRSAGEYEYEHDQDHEIAATSSKSSEEPPIPTPLIPHLNSQLIELARFWTKCRI